MAMTEATPPVSNDRQRTRRRPFSTWVRKLANFKSTSAQAARSSKKQPSKNNNPYPQSGRINAVPAASDPSLSTAQSGRSPSQPSLARSRSPRSSADGAPPTAGGRSMANTVSTDRDAEHSINAPSHVASSVAGTNRTAGGGFDRKGGDSTFSSPAPSVRSLTTTLTTIQSMGPNGVMNMTANQQGSSQTGTNTQSIQFTQPFPSSSPASAIPAHLAPHGTHPTTYNSATANNLLTDNASILTLASSSKQRRRRSMDTDASVRALAPSSLWGGSRESLPLSVLSANMEASSNMNATPSIHQTANSRVGPERASLYSTAGAAPALTSERNSLYGGKPAGMSAASISGPTGDGASMRSGLLSHGRADSISGSIGGVGSPLASPRETSDRDKERKEKDKGKKAADQSQTASPDLGISTESSDKDETKNNDDDAKDNDESRDSDNVKEVDSAKEKEVDSTKETEKE